MGVGSSIFHPESSRIARMSSGGRHGLAQSVFQVGGNMGSSLGPLLAAFFVVPHGQSSLAWCGLIAVAAIVLLAQVGRWSAHHRPPATHPAPRRGLGAAPGSVARPRRRRAAGARRADLLEVLLSRQPEQLLHLLLDQQVRAVGAERADSPVRVPRRGGGGNDSRRPDRRSHRAEVGDLGIDPRRLSVHVRAAARQPVLDRRAVGGRSA